MSMDKRCCENNMDLEVTTVTRLLFLLAACAGIAAAQVHSVTLAWNWAQGTGGAATGFAVMRAAGTPGSPPTCPTPASAYTQIAAIVSPTTLLYVDASGPTNPMQDGQALCYEIVAVGPGGSAPPSNISMAVLPFQLPAPATGLSTVAK